MTKPPVDPRLQVDAGTERGLVCFLPYIFWGRLWSADEHLAQAQTYETDVAGQQGIGCSDKGRVPQQAAEEVTIQLSGRRLGLARLQRRLLDATLSSWPPRRQLRPPHSCTESL